ncbi:MAG: HNH endonuclease [Gluconacetobacter diazotrophicus]|nr:HNH endonuclease [Gluconacetobacter diazotrophicus]
MSHIGNLQTLVLNADMQPISWGPLSVWSWQDALVAVLQNRVTTVINYEAEVRSASRSFPIPSVVALKQYHRRKRVAFTRYHVFLRDEFRCQYCQAELSAKELTFDHVVPRCRGGQTSWSNVVTCCQRDNLRKGSHSLKESGMVLLRKPFEPTPRQVDLAARRFAPRENLHRTWLDFLYWDAKLEP